MKRRILYFMACVGILSLGYVISILMDKRRDFRDFMVVITFMNLVFLTMIFEHMNHKAKAFSSIPQKILFVVELIVLLAVMSLFDTLVIGIYFEPPVLACIFFAPSTIIPRLVIAHSCFKEPEYLKFSLAIFSTAILWGGIIAFFSSGPWIEFLIMFHLFFIPLCIPLIRKLSKDKAFCLSNQLPFKLKIPIVVIQAGMLLYDIVLIGFRFSVYTPDRPAKAYLFVVLFLIIDFAVRNLILFVLYKLLRRHYKKLKEPTICATV